MTTVFDCTSRTDTSYKKRSESFFAHWNRSGRPGSEASRGLIEHWFSRVPATEQHSFRRRFRCGSNVEFATAFQELWLHELLLCLECKPRFHTAVAGSTKRPDFRVLQPDGLEFLLEAQSMTKVSSGPDSNARRDRVLDFLREFTLDGYLIGIDELIAGSKDLSQGSLARHITQGLNGIIADDSGHVSIPLLETDDGWRIRLTAIRDTSSRGNRDGGVLYEGWCRTWSGPSYPLRTALRRKSGRYGDRLSMAFVIAVNSFDAGLTDRDFDEALFGEPQIPTANGGLTRGFWGTPQTPNHRRVSAVLFTKNLWPPTVLMGHVQSCLYVNPWPECRYEGVLTKLDTVRFEDGALRRYPGAPVHEVLKLRLDRASMWE